MTETSARILLVDDEEVRAAVLEGRPVAPSSLFARGVGTLATIIQMLRLPDGTVKVLIEGKPVLHFHLAPPILGKRNARVGHPELGPAAANLGAVEPLVRHSGRGERIAVVVRRDRGIGR